MHNPKESESKMLAELSEIGIQDWWDEARCRDGEASLSTVYFSEELQDIARAKRICAECPVMLNCLEGAVARHEPWGVWGGQMFVNGKILATKRRRGRPPKVARPEDQLPEIPVPVHLTGFLRTA
jgi:WhiB family transcriptional regulator, redox-sensing transcriptional regulator